jgi:hypothetical protein
VLTEPFACAFGGAGTSLRAVASHAAAWSSRNVGAYLRRVDCSPGTGLAPFGPACTLVPPRGSANSSSALVARKVRGRSVVLDEDLQAYLQTLPRVPHQPHLKNTLEVC